MRNALTDQRELLDGGEKILGSVEKHKESDLIRAFGPIHRAELAGRYGLHAKTHDEHAEYQDAHADPEGAKASRVEAGKARSKQAEHQALLPEEFAPVK